jgi:hypothetical protein
VLLIVQVLAFVLLGALWLVGDAEFRTKAVLTLIYLASWLLGFVDGLLMIVAQGILALIFWYTAFGPTRR